MRPRAQPSQASGCRGSLEGHHPGVDSHTRVARELHLRRPPSCPPLRQRLLCSPYPTAELLSKPELADLKINADLSHWCCVCEKLFDAADARDDWWPATLTLVARHCELVHARVGHAQGPQVSQPEAPEFAAEVKAHSSWWRAIWAAQAERHTGHGATVWVTPEHGPPPYQQTLPYSQEPVAELWEVNRQMAARVRREHAAALADVTAAAAPTHLPLPPPLDFFAGDACLDGSPFAGVKAGFIFRKGDRGLGYYRDEFVPAPAFDGPKPGFVFRSGGRGTGYYRDGLVEERPAGGAAPKVGRDGSLIQAAMIEDPDVAARLGPMMGGATPAPPVGAPKGGLLSTGMESVRIEAEAAGEEEAERERRIVQATGEGVKVGAEMATAHAEGGVEFVCTSVDAPMGEIQFILVALAAMNRAAGDDHTPGGGSAHVAKMVFSAGQDQLALVAYVPEQTTLQVDAASWAQAVLTEIGGKVMCSKPQPAQSPAGGQVVCAAVRADAEEEHVPAKDLQIGMAASARFLGAAEANA